VTRTRKPTQKYNESDVLAFIGVQLRAARDVRDLSHLLLSVHVRALVRVAAAVLPLPAAVRGGGTHTHALRQREGLPLPTHEAVASRHVTAAPLHRIVNPQFDAAAILCNALLHLPPLPQQCVQGLHRTLRAG